MKYESLNNSENKRQLVSRSFVMTLASADEIFDYFNNQKGGISQEFCFLRLLLAYKTSRLKGGKRLTFFGGKIEQNENISEASQREVVEELGLQFIPIGDQNRWQIRDNNHKRSRFSHTLHNLGRFFYTFADLKRDVVLNAFYINPENIGLLGDQKIERFYSLTLEQLKNLINGGDFLGLRLEEHLRKSGDKERDKIFDKALSWFEHIDSYLKRRFEKIFSENPELTLEDFKRLYEQELIRFMKKGIERSLPNKESKSEKKEPKNEVVKAIIEGLNGGFLGTDVMYFLPHIAHLLVNGEKHQNVTEILRNSTEATLNFWVYFNNIYEDFLKEKNISFETLKNLAQKSSFISDFNDFVLRRLKEDFSLSDASIELVTSQMREFWSQLEKDLKNADDELTKGLVQNYRLLNEVANASLGRLILLFLGIDNPGKVLNGDENNYRKRFRKKIIFEAGSQLLYLMKGFLSADYFREKSKPEALQKVNLAVEEYFGSSVDSFLIISKNNTNIYNVEKRQRRNGWQSVVDEKPVKEWISFIRKSFKERPEDIIDFSSYSIVYLGDDKDDFIQQLLDGGFREEFERFLEEQYPGSKIILEEKSTFGLREYAQKNSNEINTKGKRTGSQAKRVVALKYILTIDGQSTEIVIYPYLSTKQAKNDNNGFWMGWLEKREDDNNYKIRRMLAGENGAPSFYDLNFPPDIYPEAYKHRLQSTYHN